MKKKFLEIIAVFILSLFIIPSRAHATNGKTLTITDSLNNPNTSDNISMYIGLFIISVLSIGTILSLRKKVNY